MSITLLRYVEEKITTNGYQYGYRYGYGRNQNIRVLIQVSSSYYTLSIVYCDYCMKLKGVKHLRASAVKYAIRHWKSVVGSLPQNKHASKKRGPFDLLQG